MQTQTTPPSPHRLHYLVLTVTLAVVLVIGAVIAIIVAAGNNEPKPVVTKVSAGVSRQLAASNAAAALRFENDTIAVLVPSNRWSGAKSSTTLQLLPPDKAGVNIYQSSRFSGTVVQLFQAVAGNFSRGYQNPKLCGKPAAQRVPNGPAGVIFILCGTYVPQNGQAFPVAELSTIGVGGGNAAGIFWLTRASTAYLKRMLAETSPVYRSVHWKLF